MDPRSDHPTGHSLWGMSFVVRQLKLISFFFGQLGLRLQILSLAESGLEPSPDDLRAALQAAEMLQLLGRRRHQSRNGYRDGDYHLDGEWWYRISKDGCAPSSRLVGPGSPVTTASEDDWLPLPLRDNGQNRATTSLRETRELAYSK